MNSIVRLWERSLARPKPAATDTVNIDGEDYVMADRKLSPKMLKNVALTGRQLDNLVTMVLEAPLPTVLQIRTATFNALKRVGVGRDTTKAAGKNPHGSVQVDVGSVLDWLARVTPADKKAVAQLVMLDATCCARGT